MVNYWFYKQISCLKISCLYWKIKKYQSKWTLMSFIAFKYFRLYDFNGFLSKIFILIFLLKATPKLIDWSWLNFLKSLPFTVVILLPPKIN
jgi:hypothetical protein